MKTRPWLWAILDILAGVLACLAFPPYSILPLFWIFSAYFLWRLDSATSYRQVFWRGIFYGFGFFWAGYYWIVHTMHSFGQIPIPIGIVGTTIFVLGTSLEFALAGVLIRWGLTRLGKNYGSIFCYTVSVAALIDIHFPELFPWDAALLFAPFPFWLQTLDLFGEMGVSMVAYFGVVALWMNVSPRFSELRVSKKKLGLLWSPFLVGILLSLFYARSFGEYWKNPTIEKTVHVTGVQANIGSADKLSATTFRIDEKMNQVMLKYLSMSRQAEKTDLIVWPETAFPDYISMSPIRREWVLALARERKTDFLIGSFDSTFKKNEYQVFNGIFLIDHEQSRVVDHYQKHVLLAFGEYLPLGSVFPKLKRFFPMVSDFSAGPGPDVIEWRGTKIGVSICYEAILPGFIRGLVELKPDFFLNITNDSWFGDTREPWFHLYLQVMRSIEHRIPAVRLANTGISAFVTPYGELKMATTYDSEALLSGPVALPHREDSIYQRGGYAVITSILLLLAIWFGTRRKI